MAKQKGALLASITAIAILIAVIFGGCGQQPEEVPVDSSISSETDETKVDESVETPAEPEKESEKEETETPASTEEEVVLTSDNYLTEMSQGDCFEFKYSDYNSEYEVGNRITLTVEMESNGTFNGCVGSCVGSSYEWQQEEFEFEAGRHTATWTVTPSLDECQLNLWYADSAPVGVVSINVTIEEVEPAVIGKIATFTEQDTFEFTFSEYNSEYKVGDLVKISVVMESDGDFNGSIGASVGRDYTWNQKEFKYDEGGKYTLTWTVKPSSDYSNIGIWWVGGTSVGIHSITVTVLEEEIGIHGDYITMFTDEGNFEFVPSLVNPSFKFGDKIRITVTFESDGEFTGSLGTCVGSNYEWTQTEYESDTGISTWVLDISPVIDSVQLGVWYIGGTAVGILDIDVEILSWGYQHNEVKGLIYTSTQKNDTYPFMPSDYCEFEDGDIITIRVELDSNDVYNGCVGVNDINGTYRSANFSSNGGTVFCELVVEASTKEAAKIEFWWMNTKVALNSITVTKGGTIVDTNDDDIYYPGEVTKFRTASDYCDYKAGDTITVTVTLSGDGYFNGALGMAGIDWIQKDFESADGSPVTCTITVPNAVSQLRDIQIGIWWSEGSYVKIESITVTKDSSNDNEDDDQPDSNEQIDTSSWQLAFNGFTKEWGGWNSVSGDTGKLEFQATVQDIMTANNIADISEFGGFLFQIWHVDSKYDGRTYTYSLDINGNTYKGGEGIIQCNEYNSTDVIQITTDDYAFTPQDVIHGVITVSAAEEPDSAIYTFKYDEWKAIQDNNAATGKNDAYTYSFSPSKYGEFADGDTINVTVTLQTDGSYFNGVLGANDASGSWNSSDAKDSSSSQWTWTLPNAGTNENMQIQIWWMNDDTTYVKVTDIQVQKEGAEEPDSAIYTFEYDEWKAIQDNNTATGKSDSYTYSFSPSKYGEFTDGDTINVTVTMETDGSYYNGVLGANDASGSWSSSDQKDSSSSQWTWTLPNAGTNENMQIQIWWMNDDTTYVKVTDITVVKEEGEEPDNDADVVFSNSITGTAAASTDWNGTEISLSDLIGNTKPSTITSIEFSSDKPFTIGYNGADGWSQVENEASYSLTDIATSGYYLKIVFTAQDDAEHTIIWKVHAEESEAPAASLTSTDDEKTWSFSLSDYVSDLQIGDEVEIVAKFESISTDGWGGGLGAACADVEYNWKQVDFSNESPTVTLTVTVPATDDNNPNTGAQVQLWWGGEDAGVDVYIVSVTRTGTASTTALDASLQLLSMEPDESTTNSLTKSNAIEANGEGTKNTAPDATNDIDGVPSVSGNDAGEAESDSLNTVSGNDTADTEEEDNTSDYE